ncbi:hypothetical protein AAG906_009602 [Vitis piasezkii]
MEEDAGKLLYFGNESYSQVDLNKVGVPLHEIVSKPKCEEAQNMVILPSYAPLPFLSVELLEKVLERKEPLTLWTTNKKEIGAYGMSLQQIDNDVIIPRSGWKYAKCDKTENLWLNLTNGMIPYRRLSGNELPSV